VKPDLLILIDHLAKEQMESIRERKNGYPQTRRRIKEFIATLPIEQQEMTRKILLPETHQ
jgi:hypothetical protein